MQVSCFDAEFLGKKGQYIYYKMPWLCFFWQAVEDFLSRIHVVINILGKSVNLNGLDVYATCDATSENIQSMVYNQFDHRPPVKLRYVCLENNNRKMMAMPTATKMTLTISLQ